MVDMVRKAMASAILTLLTLVSLSHAYPMMSNGKRFTQRSWPPYPVYYQPRSTRLYAPFYDTYIPDSVDLYYPQDPYDKYRVYQMPQYYYPEQYYYDEEVEEPEEDDISSYGSIPDAWYNSPNADANAVFLQNLVLAQMYRDAASRGQRYPTTPYLYPKSEDYDDDTGSYVYGEPVKEVIASPAPKEDKDVRDLKSLIDTGKQRRKSIDGSRRSLEENRWVNKRDDLDSTLETPADSSKEKKELKGQDEVVMTRPATPSRTSSFHQRSYQPSAYDAIKKLLIQQNNEKDRQPQKRSYVLNEDSLVAQLGKLKKSS